MLLKWVLILNIVHKISSKHVTKYNDKLAQYL